MNDKRLTLLGFAAKAGRLAYGMDAVLTALKKNQARLVVTADDVSQKSKKEVSFHAAGSGTAVLILEGCNMETLSRAVGRRCGILSVNDDGFASALQSKAVITGGNANDNQD